MSDGYEPHGLLLTGDWLLAGTLLTGGGGGGVPGVVGYWVGWEGAIPVPSPIPSQGPYFIIFSLKALPTAK